MRPGQVAAAAAREAGTTFVEGEAIFIRTVTYHMTGRLERISHVGPCPFLHLSEPAWIAESARWADSLKTGELREVEPGEDEARIAVASIVDVWHWNHPLPRTQK